MTAQSGTRDHSVAEQTITGWSGDDDYFAFREYNEFRPEGIVDVLRAGVAGVIFRGMVSPDTCASLATRFWGSRALKERGSEAPGYYLGTYHYHKLTAQYLDESEKVAGPLAEALDVPGEPVARIRQGLSKTLAPEGGVFRVARHNGRPACQALLRSWHGEGEFALVPHEDRAQCGEPRQADFEIQRVLRHHVGAFNVCLENGQGGRLVYWNIQPDEASKRRLGLQYSGSPYPAECLKGFEQMRVDIRPGDVYVFNGAHVHAVEPNTDPQVRRTTLSGLLGFIDDKTVVSWT